MSTMYIAIEGSKGTGKTTLLHQLERAFQADVMHYQVFSPTRSMPEGSWWEKAYDTFAEDPNFIESLYHERANYHASLINFEAPLILGDRSILTSFVTRWPDQQCALKDYIQLICAKEYAVPIPDLVIYLDLSVELTRKRLLNRQRNYGHYDEQVERLIRAKTAYDEFFNQKNDFGFSHLRYQYIDASQKQKDVFYQIYHIVKTELSNKSNFE